jgi:hypothetical protein
MKVNSECSGATYVEVYFNGGKLDRCFEADEETGEAWVAVEDADRHLIGEDFAPPRALVCMGAMVTRLRGKVEIRVVIPEGDHSTEAFVREQLAASYSQIIKVK